MGARLRQTWKSCKKCGRSCGGRLEMFILGHWYAVCWRCYTKASRHLTCIARVSWDDVNVTILRGRRRARRGEGVGVG
jgi:hypothetical protein